MGIIDLIVLGCGLYILYHTYTMVKEQVIPEGVLLNKGVTIPKDADVSGFIEIMKWKAVAVGVSCCASGICGLLTSYIQGSVIRYVSWIVSILFFVVLVYFMWNLRKAQKNYLHLK